MIFKKFPKFDKIEFGSADIQLYLSYNNFKLQDHYIVLNPDALETEFVRAENFFKWHIHQYITRSFYACRSQNRKKIQLSCQSFLSFWALRT